MTQQLTIPQPGLPTIRDEATLIDIRRDRQRYPHFCDYPPMGRLQWLKLQMARVYQIRHQVVDAEVLRIDAELLHEEMENDASFKQLTLIEIENAFKNGAKGQYGPTYGLTIETFLDYLWGFVNDNKSTYKKLYEEKYREKINAEEEARKRELREQYAEELLKARKI